MLTRDTNPFPQKTAFRQVSGPVALAVSAFVLAACSSAAPQCDDENVLGALESVWSDHAVLLPSGGALGTGSFSDFRDVSEEAEDLPSDTRACAVEVFDAGGRVIRSVYHANADGITIMETEVVERFTPQ